MIKDNVKVKELLSEADKINMTNFLCEGYFFTADDGSILYTPYLREINWRTAFFLYAVEGLTFEAQKDEDGNIITDGSGETSIESAYDCSVSDDELDALYKKVFTGRSKTYETLKSQLSIIENDVLDMVDFKKQQIIHTQKDTLTEYLNVISEKMSSIDFNAINAENKTKAAPGPDKSAL